MEWTRYIEEFEEYIEDFDKEYIEFVEVEEFEEFEFEVQPEVEAGIDIVPGIEAVAEIKIEFVAEIGFDIRFALESVTE